jgi:hypothetical protein
MKFRLFTAFLIWGSFSQASAEEINELEGYWSNNCDYNDASIRHSKSNSFVIELASNQIYVSVTAIKKPNSSGYEIYFIKPSSLGAGGAKINWTDISTNSPIGFISNIKKSNYHFKFNGLTFIKTGRKLTKYMFHGFSGKKELITKCF